MSDDLNKNTDPFSENDAAYVMGALTDQDRRAFEAHLVDCPECTQSVAELSGMPAMLDKVPLARLFEPGARPEPPPDLLLRRLIAATRKQRRRQSVRLVASGAVAASLGRRDGRRWNGRQEGLPTGCPATWRRRTADHRAMGRPARSGCQGRRQHEPRGEWDRHDRAAGGCRRRRSAPGPASRLIGVVHSGGHD